MGTMAGQGHVMTPSRRGPRSIVLPAWVAGKGWGKEGTCQLQAPCQPLLCVLASRGLLPPRGAPFRCGVCISPTPEQHPGPLVAFVTPVFWCELGPKEGGVGPELVLWGQCLWSALAG